MKPGILAQLRAVEGVTGAVITAADGVVLDADIPQGDAESEAAVTVFIGTAAGQLSEALRLDAFSHGVITMKNKRLLIVPQHDRYIGVILAENTSAAIVASAATEILRQ